MIHLIDKARAATGGNRELDRELGAAFPPLQPYTADDGLVYLRSAENG